MAFEGNQGVPDVQVRAEGESVFKSRSLFFTPLFKSESVESTDSTTWSCTIPNPLKDHKSGTVEMWLRTPSNSSQTIFYGMSGASFDINYSDGKIHVSTMTTTYLNRGVGRSESYST